MNEKKHERLCLFFVFLGLKLDELADITPALLEIRPDFCVAIV